MEHTGNIKKSNRRNLSITFQNNIIYKINYVKINILKIDRRNPIKLKIAQNIGENKTYYLLRMKKTAKAHF